MIKMCGAQVVVLSSILQHVIDGRKQRGRHGTDGFLWPAAAAQAVELSLVVAVLLSLGGPGTLHEHGLQPRRSFAEPGAFALAGALILSRAKPGPGDEMTGAREAAHVAADLRQDRRGS